MALIAALVDRLPDLSGWSRPGCRIDSLSNILIQLRMILMVVNLGNSLCIFVLSITCR